MWRFSPPPAGRGPPRAPFVALAGKFSTVREARKKRCPVCPLHHPPPVIVLPGPPRVSLHQEPRLSPHSPWQPRFQKGFHPSGPRSQVSCERDSCLQAGSCPAFCVPGGWGCFSELIAFAKGCALAVGSFVEHVD